MSTKTMHLNSSYAFIHILYVLSNERYLTITRSDQGLLVDLVTPVDALILHVLRANMSHAIRWLSPNHTQYLFSASGPVLPHLPWLV